MLRLYVEKKFVELIILQAWMRNNEKVNIYVATINFLVIFHQQKEPGQLFELIFILIFFLNYVSAIFSLPLQYFSNL